MNTKEDVGNHVQVQLPPQPHSTFGWVEIASGIANGSWAVLLVLVLIYWLTKDNARRYFEKHMALLDTMRKSLESNSASLTSLAESEKIQSVSLSELKAQNRDIKDSLSRANRKTDEAIKLLYNLQDLHDEAHTPAIEVDQYGRRALPRHRTRAYVDNIEDHQDG